MSMSAAQALTNYHWPENTRQLRRIVRDAVSRTDLVDVRHLPGLLFAGTSRRLSRMRPNERGEIVRCLTAPGTSVAQAAEALGMSRATVYRKIAQYGIASPPWADGPRGPDGPGARCRVDSAATGPASPSGFARGS